MDPVQGEIIPDEQRTAIEPEPINDKKAGLKLQLDPNVPGLGAGAFSGGRSRDMFVCFF